MLILFVELSARKSYYSVKAPTFCWVIITFYKNIFLFLQIRRWYYILTLTLDFCTFFVIYWNLLEFIPSNHPVLGMNSSRSLSVSTVVREGERGASPLTRVLGSIASSKFWLRYLCQSIHETKRNINHSKMYTQYSARGKIAFFFVKFIWLYTINTLINVLTLYMWTAGTIYVRSMCGRRIPSGN